MRLCFLTKTKDTEAALILQGQAWSIQKYDVADSESLASLPFSCVSYTWGLGREPSPFKPNVLVSNRTVPALNSFIRHRPNCQRIWIDAFCVPHGPPERESSLESMGWIYSQAKQVVAVLSEASLPALECMSKSDRIHSEHLLTLEQEEWVSRAWTYQETVNSRELFITCEGAHDTIVEGDHFLNCVGYTMSLLPESALEKRLRYPRLDALEDVIVDYLTANYEERSALRVMANVDRRIQTRPEDHFYAMIGAISIHPASSAGDVEPCEAFMSLCEKKGDFSFIYSAAKREALPGRRWRPLVGDIPAIVPWDCYGGIQHGRIEPDGLRLENMVILQITALGEEAKTFVNEWLHKIKYPIDPAKQSLAESCYDAVRLMGFAGADGCIETDSGLFFPFEKVPQSYAQQVIVSATIKWVFGAPGFAAYERSDESGLFYTPGVLVGKIDTKFASTIKIG